MATRQYIGARYVLKIYQNSQDASSAEWESGVVYEPLTMVTYQNSSYVSRSQVPANAGDPATATTYWAITGAYNGQIADLQSRVSEIEEEVPAYNRSVYDKYIFIGDSYAENSDDRSWVTTVVSDLGLVQGVTYWKNALTSTGFSKAYQGKTFTTLLNEVAAQLTDDEKTSITKICVCGGFNDHDQTYANILNAISNFVSAANSAFPNARVYVGHIGWSVLAEIRAHLRNTVIPAYSACSLKGAIYIKNIEYAFHNYTLFQADGTHPSSAGSVEIAHHITEGLRSGGTSVIRARDSMAFTYDNDGFFSEMRNAFWVTQINDITLIEPYDCILTCKSAMTMNFSQAYLIGNVVCPLVRGSVGTGLDYSYIPLNCLVSSTGGVEHVCEGALELKDDKAYLTIYPHLVNAAPGAIANVTAVIMYRKSFALPTLMV